MRKFLLWITLFCAGLNLDAQRLLSWTPEFPVDNSTLSFTVDCTKGNQGLLNFEGGNSNNVYVHVGVITSSSTGPTDCLCRLPCFWPMLTGSGSAPYRMCATHSWSGSPNPAMGSSSHCATGSASRRGALS